MLQGKILAQKKIGENRSKIPMDVTSGPTCLRDLCDKRNCNHHDAQRVDSKEAANEKRPVQLSPTEPEPSHRHHQDETGMNKEEQPSPPAQSPEEWVPLGNSECAGQMVR